VSAAFEAFLARLYIDAEARAAFLADPLAEARRAGLDAKQAAALAAIDRPGLELAARSITAKRSATTARTGDGRRWRWPAWLGELGYSVGRAARKR
jgi:hypothetical protein